MHSSFSDRPEFARPDWQGAGMEPCKEEHRHGQDWHFGSGVPPAGHPLNRQIPFQGCEGCSSGDVLVIAAQWSVSYHSGDAYWDYELWCRQCHGYTQRSYAEND